MSSGLAITAALFASSSLMQAMLGTWAHREACFWGGTSFGQSQVVEQFAENVRFLRPTLGGHLPPVTDQSGASFSSHIRMPFHNVGISGNNGHRRRCAAK